MTTAIDAGLVDAYHRARHRLDRELELLNRGLDLREQLTWGVFDQDTAARVVGDFKRSVLILRRRR